MLTRRHLAVGVALVMLAIGASAVAVVSSTRRAGARCSGSTPVLMSRYNASGTLVAQESVTYPGTTCNGDGTYSGAVLDASTDGSCATAYYLEPTVYYAAQGTSCTTGAWAVYTYADTIGGNSVLVSVRPTYLADDWVTSSGY
jgi:hypothetical protein